MPVFSCGGMRFQHSWQDVELSAVPEENQANLAATVRRALELGINHIETARGYGSSERQLGKVLGEIPRESLIVQTKIPPVPDGNEFRSQFLDSLSRLRMDHVDLLGIHGINTYERLHWATRAGGCLEAARRLVKEGRVRHVGFSTHGELDLILAAVATEAHGGFDYINLHWYYIFQRNWPAIVAAANRDMGVFIISPSDKGGMLYQPSQRLVELCDPLHPLVFNCLFCLTRPEVHTLSLGASCPADFDQQCSCLDQMGGIDGQVAAITARLDAELRQVGGGDAQGYLQGLPLWHNTPGYVNLPMILWLRQLLIAFDLHDYCKMRYNQLGRAGHWFGGMPADRLEWMDWDKVLAQSPFRDQIPGWIADAHQRLQGPPQKRLSEG